MKYTEHIEETITYLFAGILSLVTLFIVDADALLFASLVFFFMSIWHHDEAMEEWTIIKDNASMDRPE